MLNTTEMSDRTTDTANGLRRIAILASVCGFALAAAALPVEIDDSGLVLKQAYAAGGNGNGKGHGRDGAPGQLIQQGAANATEAAADTAISESGGQEDIADELPIAEDAPANVQVIKEIAGLSDDSELSEEEELEAIRSGWGTWRTADGPESVISR